MSIEVTDATFETEVLERSAEIPVIVDLWAPWCSPCRKLTPILEKVVADTNGQVLLAKVNVDENPMVSASFQVQGIPAVYAIRDKKVVNGFIGGQGETAVRQFVESLLPSADEQRIAELLANGDEASLREVLETDPGHAVAVVALAELLVGKGQQDEALALLERIPDTAEKRRVAALARVGGEEPAEDDMEGKLNRLLDRVKDDDKARQEFIDLLELLGPDDPRTARYRKALTAKLY